MMANLPMNSPYKMSISLNVLNHLGINLYSNIPAVLSELVANAWDADATEVHINFTQDSEKITIADNGHGMSKSDINDRFLTVGYSRRTRQPARTNKNRQPMGRKGIGKLAAFSIADTMEIHSIKNGERNGLRMRRQDIQEQIEKEGEGIGDYYPTEIAPQNINIEVGTQIILTDIRANRRTSLTETYLKQRIARRFTVLGENYDFRVFVNSEEVTARDRGFFNFLEFIWFFGEPDQLILDNCKPDIQVFRLSNELPDGGYIVKGWIGSVEKPKQLSDHEAGNSIVVFTRGKLVQENILPEFKEARAFAQYLVGDVEADFIDVDNMEDLATSDRQRLVSEDPRYKLLKNHIYEAVKKIGLQWTDLRNVRGAEKALTNPVIKKWYQKMTPDNQKHAKKLFGKIESLPYSDESTRFEMYKASILAFEKMALAGQLTALDDLEPGEGLEALLAIFKSIDDIEAVHYYEIAKGRLQVIREFADLVDENEKERVLQNYLFDHLWLLDPSWDRATGSERLEQSVKAEFEKVAPDLTDDEAKGRIDIRYKTLAGKHVIVELKRAKVNVEITELVKQINKYRTALKKVLEQSYRDYINLHIEIICVLGQGPTPKDDPQTNTNLLSAVGGRYVTYDQLIDSAQTAYAAYLEREKEVSDVAKLLKDLEESLKEPW